MHIILFHDILRSTADIFLMNVIHDFICLGFSDLPGTRGQFCDDLVHFESEKKTG